MDENQLAVYARELGELYRVEKEKSLALEQALARAQQVERLREQMVSNISHELRTPLTPILGWTRVLKARADQLPPEVLEFVETVDIQASRLHKLIESLLRVAAIERNEETIKAGRVNLRAIVEKASSAAGRKVEIEVEDRARWATGDPAHFQEIFTQLIDNAVKFSPEDSQIWVSATFSEGSLLVRVTDRGQGIPPEDRERVFESFVQADGGSTRLYGGAGVGLHICRQLVQLYGGKMWIEDPDGVPIVLVETPDEHPLRRDPR